MGDLFAAGGIKILEEQLVPFHQAIDDLCLRYRFPKGQEFKWSPGKELWMRYNLIGQQRTAFFSEAFTIAVAHHAKGIFVMADSVSASATGATKANMTP